MAQELRMKGCGVDDIAAFVNWDHSSKVDHYLLWPGPAELTCAAGFKTPGAYMVPRRILDPCTIHCKNINAMAMDLFAGMDEDLVTLSEVCV